MKLQNNDNVRTMFSTFDHYSFKGPIELRITLVRFVHVIRECLISLRTLEEIRLCIVESMNKVWHLATVQLFCNYFGSSMILFVFDLCFQFLLLVVNCIVVEFFFNIVLVKLFLHSSFQIIEFGHKKYVSYSKIWTMLVLEIKRMVYMCVEWAWVSPLLDMNISIQIVRICLPYDF